MMNANKANDDKVISNQAEFHKTINCDRDEYDKFSSEQSSYDNVVRN